MTIRFGHLSMLSGLNTCFKFPHVYLTELHCLILECIGIIVWHCYLWVVLVWAEIMTPKPHLSSLVFKCFNRYFFLFSHSLDLHQQIEELQSHLLRSQAHISNMEQEFENKLQTTNYELLKTREELVKLRDRYER